MAEEKQAPTAFGGLEEIVVFFLILAAIIYRAAVDDATAVREPTIIYEKSLPEK